MSAAAPPIGQGGRIAEPMLTGGWLCLLCRRAAPDQRAAGQGLPQRPTKEMRCRWIGQRLDRLFDCGCAAKVFRVRPTLEAAAEAPGRHPTEGRAANGVVVEFIICAKLCVPVTGPWYGCARDAPKR